MSRLEDLGRAGEAELARYRRDRVGFVFHNWRHLASATGVSTGALSRTASVPTLSSELRQPIRYLAHLAGGR